MYSIHYITLTVIKLNFKIIKNLILSNLDKNRFYSSSIQNSQK